MMEEEPIWIVTRIAVYTSSVVGYIKNEKEIDAIREMLEEKQKKEYSHHLGKYVYPQIKIEKIHKIILG